MARGGRWIADASVACPVLVPLTSLGRRVVATEGDGARADSFAIAAAPAARAAGGTQLRATCLSEELFAAAAMEAVQKDLMAMKVTELKEELEARGEPKTGAKAWLRRRLHRTPQFCALIWSPPLMMSEILGELRLLPSISLYICSLPLLPF